MTSLTIDVKKGGGEHLGKEILTAKYKGKQI